MYIDRKIIIWQREYIAPGSATKEEIIAKLINEETMINEESLFSEDTEYVEFLDPYFDSGNGNPTVVLMSDDCEELWTNREK